jgi:hypothetical protein
MMEQILFHMDGSNFFFCFEEKNLMKTFGLNIKRKFEK